MSTMTVRSFWNGMGRHVNLECIWTALRLGQRFPSKGGCENIHQWMLRDQLHAYDFVFGCVDGRQACE